MSSSKRVNNPCHIKNQIKEQKVVQAIPFSTKKVLKLPAFKNHKAVPRIKLQVKYF